MKSEKLAGGLGLALILMGLFWAAVLTWSDPSMAVTAALGVATIGFIVLVTVAPAFNDD